jgi:hypothetical protein
MPKTVAIVQSSYIPWKGYFDLIRHSDEFILLDDVQFTRRDWRSRNLIKTAQGVRWLTIPLQNKGNYQAPIRAMKIADPTWNERHWQLLRQAYGESKYYAEVAPLIGDLYRHCSHTSLSDINRHFISAICSYLDIRTPISWSWDYSIRDHDRNGRLIELCRAAGANCYLSGPSAKTYLDLQRFRKAGVEVRFFDYSGYPVYRQLYGNFCHEVSILDMIFNEGKNSVNLFKKIISISDEK